jgi:hypothetical protein
VGSVRAAAGAVRVLLPILVSAWCLDAHAYRPFDGTDADVAELHELELELGPAGYYGVAGQTHDFVAGGVINYGLLPRVELVLQGFDFAPLDAQSGPNRFIDTGLFVKVVWREGCLQDQDGPSFATETGPLLPTVNDTKGFGAYAGSILSTCLGESLVVHWNVEAQILPQTFDLDLFGGVILEPTASPSHVRPVAEFFVEHDFGGGGLQTYSGLFGAIWQVGAKFALDAALREAIFVGPNVTPASEVRAGFSWAIP